MTTRDNHTTDQTCHHSPAHAVCIGELIGRAPKHRSIITAQSPTQSWGLPTTREPEKPTTTHTHAHAHAHAPAHAHTHHTHHTQSVEVGGPDTKIKYVHHFNHNVGVTPGPTTISGEQKHPNRIRSQSQPRCWGEHRLRGLMLSRSQPQSGRKP